MLPEGIPAADSSAKATVVLGRATQGCHNRLHNRLWGGALLGILADVFCVGFRHLLGQGD